jgi:hypothetical protein
MSDKAFGAKKILLVGATETPSITSPTNLNINANTVAISTDATIGGKLGIGTTNPISNLDVFGNISVGTAGTNPAIISRKNTNSLLALGGGSTAFNTTGANIELYGATHSTSAGRAYYDALNHNFRDLQQPPAVYAFIGTDTAYFNSTYFGIGTTIPGEKLQVDGNIRVGISTTSNYIAFRGTFGDGTNESGGSQGVGFNLYTHTYIGERIYSPRTEQSELLIYKGNDSGINSAGPDRIRLAGVGGIVFDTSIHPGLGGHYSFEEVGVSTNFTTKMALTQAGNLGIGTTAPTSKLHVEGDALVTGISTLGPVQIYTSNNNGIVTATSGITTLFYYGDGSGLKNLNASAITGSPSVAISSNTADQAQYLTYVTGIGTVSGLNVNTAGLVYNPYSGSLGIGTTAPKAKLHVYGGDVLIDFLLDRGTISNTLERKLTIGGARNQNAGPVASINFSNFDDNSSQIEYDAVRLVARQSPSWIDGGELLIYTTGSGSTIAQERVRITDAGSVGIGTSIPTSTVHIVGNGITTGEALQVDGNIRVGISTTSNYIAFRGTYNDGVNAEGEPQYPGFYEPYTHTYIGERIFDPGTERSELLLFKGDNYNRDINNHGPDRIRLAATGGIVFDTIIGIGTTVIHGTFEQVGTSTQFATRMILADTGNLGIGTTAPTSKLHVEGDALVTGISTLGLVKIYSNGTSGIITAASIGSTVFYYGDGSGLKNLNATAISGGSSITISSNTDNQAQYLTYVTGTGSVNGLNVNTAGLVYNPYTGNVGLGITNPQSTLHVLNSDITKDTVIQIHNDPFNNLDTLGVTTYRPRSVIAFSENGITYGTTPSVIWYGNKPDSDNFSANDNSTVIGNVHGSTTNINDSQGGVWFAVRKSNLISAEERYINLYAAGISSEYAKLSIQAGLSAQGNFAIGTDFPESKLHVAGNTYISGNLGIGTTNPKATLDVGVGSVYISNGDIYLNGSTFAFNTRDAGGGYFTNGGADGHGYFNNINPGGIAGFQVKVPGVGSTSGTFGAANTDNMYGTLITRHDGTQGITYFNGLLGIGTTAPTSKLHVQGDALVTGVSTLSSVKIYSNGTNGIVTSSNPGVTTVFYYGDGSGLKNIPSSAFVGNLGLGTDTYGDYVKSISGTLNEIEVSITSGEGVSPIIGLPNDVTIANDLTVKRNLQVDQNLNVTGNITVGGTTAYLIVNNLQIRDKDIILGINTNGSGNDISTDITADHGGIAIASTEGTPLVSLQGVGNSLPDTYKQLMWLQKNPSNGLYTDAWVFNYGVGIGSTQIANGVRLAVGNDITMSDNSITAGYFYGDGSGLTGIKATAISGGSSVTISSNTTDQAQYLTYVTGIGTVSQLGVNTTGLVYNPSSGSLGIGTTAPTSKLHVQGNANISGITTVQALNINTNGIEAGDLGSNGGPDGIFGIYNTSIGGTITVNLKDSGGTSNSIVSLSSTIATVNGNLRVGFSTTSNHIAFRGTHNDGVTAQGADQDPPTTLAYTHTYIGERIYASSGVNKKSELLLFKGNDIVVDNGPDRIRLAATGGIVFDTSSAQLSGTFEEVATSSLLSTKMALTQVGNLGIGTTTPTSTLHVQGSVRITGALYDTNNSIGSTNQVLQSVGTGISWVTFSGGGGGTVSISTNTTNQAQYLTYAIGTGSTTGFGVTTSGLVFNPSTTSLGIGITNPSYNLHVNGSFGATTKSFIINHPTKEGKKLQYGSLESPYHGIRLTGSSTIKTGKCVVELPDYIHTFVKEEGINIHITNIKHGKVLWVDEVDVANNRFIIMTEETSGEYDFYWDFTAIRKDVEDMIVEF